MSRGREFSPEIGVMLRPSRAFRQLAALHPVDGTIRALRRPAFFSFLCGCMVSFVASQRLTMRHVIAGTATASLLIACQLAALASLCWGQRKVSLPQAIDLFFMSYGPWAFWMLAFSAIWALATPIQALRWAGFPAILATGGLAAMWCGYIDFHFFRQVLHRGLGRSVWDVFLFRVLAWSAAIAIFGGGSLWPGLTGILNR